MLVNRSGHGATASGIVIEGQLLSKLKSNPTVRAWVGDYSHSVAESDICKAIEKVPYSALNKSGMSWLQFLTSSADL